MVEQAVERANRKVKELTAELEESKRAFEMVGLLRLNIVEGFANRKS